MSRKTPNYIFYKTENVLLGNRALAAYARKDCQYKKKSSVAGRRSERRRGEGCVTTPPSLIGWHDVLRRGGGMHVYVTGGCTHAWWRPTSTPWLYERRNPLHWSGRSLKNQFCRWDAACLGGNRCLRTLSSLSLISFVVSRWVLGLLPPAVFALPLRSDNTNYGDEPKGLDASRRGKWGSVFSFIRQVSTKRAIFNPHDTACSIHVAAEGAIRLHLRESRLQITSICRSSRGSSWI